MRRQVAPGHVHPKPVDMGQKHNLIILSILIVVLAVLLLEAPGTGDVSVWMDWMRLTYEQPFVPAYTQIADYYPPGTLIVLHSVDLLSEALDIGTFFFFKVSLLFFLLLTSAIFFRFARNIVLTLLLQLALTLNSVALGYLDIYIAPLLLLSLYALHKRKFVTGGVLYAASFLIKWQPLVIAPFLILYAVNITDLRDIKKIDFKPIAQLLIPIILIVAITLGIFGAAFPEALNTAMEDPYEGFLSGYALNFNWILTYLLQLTQPDTYGEVEYGFIFEIEVRDPAVTTPPFLVFVVLYGLALFRFFTSEKTFENLILFSLAGYLSYFVFNTGVHENHLFMAVILTAVLMHLNKDRYLSTFVVWALVFNINMFVFYGIDGTGPEYSRIVYGNDPTVFLSVVNVLIFLLLYAQVVVDKRFVGRLLQRFVPVPTTMAEATSQEPTEPE